MSDAEDIARVRLLLQSLPRKAVIVWSGEDTTIHIDTSSMSTLEVLGLLELGRLAAIREGRAYD